MNSVQQSARQALEALLHSYAQVWLSRSRPGGLLLPLATLIDPIPGLHGLAAVALALLLAWALHLPEPELREGIYGYNPLLAGVGAVVLGTAAARSVLGGALRLPGLSLPFVHGPWLALAAGWRRACPGPSPPSPSLTWPPITFPGRSTSSCDASGPCSSCRSPTRAPWPRAP